MRTFFCFFVYIACFTTISAQQSKSGATYLLPIREQHLWSFVDLNGEPTKREFKSFAEALGMEYLPWNNVAHQASASPYRLIQKNGKVGLMDSYLNMVLPCDYKRIKPLQKTCFAVELDSFLMIVDNSMPKPRILSGDYRWQDIIPVDPSLNTLSNSFFVKKNGYWGLQKSGGEVTIDPQYYEIRSAKTDQYFMVKKELQGQWGLINRQNEIILPFEYKSILYFNDSFIAVCKSGNQWYVVDIKNKVMKSGKQGDTWVDVLPLNSYLAVIKKEEITKETRSILSKYYIIDTRSNKIIHDNYFSFVSPISETFFMYSNAGAFLKSIIDINQQNNQTGELFINTENRFAFKSIISSELPEIFIVDEDRFFRQQIHLYNASTNFLSKGYAEIKYVGDSIFMCKVDSAYGLTNKHFEELLPPSFKKIDIESNLIKCISFDGVQVVFKIVHSRKIVPYDESKNIISLSKVKNFSDATLLTKNKNTSKPIYTNEDEVQIHNGDIYYFGSNNSIIWRFNKKAKLWELAISINTRDSVLLQAKYTDFYNLPDQNFLKGRHFLIFEQENALQSTFANVFGILERKLCRAKLFDFKNNKVKTEVQILGLRTKDFDDIQIAAFIDTSGKMGLMRETGEELKDEKGDPLRFTYVGKFVRHYGKAEKWIAPVCTGGILSVDKKDEINYKYYIEPHLSFFNEFRMHEPRRIQYNGGGASSKSVYVASGLGGDKPKWGYIDQDGKFLLTPQFDFANELMYIYQFAFVFKDDFFGAINSDMELIYDIKYNSITLYNGFFKLATKVAQKVLYRPDGNQVCEADYDSYGDGFHENMCPVKKNGFWGFIDTSGLEVIKCVYESVFPFSEGKAVVKKDNCWLVINKNGEMIFEPELSWGTLVDFGQNPMYHNNRLRYKTLINKLIVWGYFNATGGVAIEPKYTVSLDFSEGLACVRYKVNNKLSTAVIDTLGNAVIEHGKYDIIFPYNQYGSSVASIKKGGPYFMIDRLGNPYNPKLKYDTIWNFNAEYAKVLKSKKYYGLIRWDGVEVIPPIYSKMDTLSEGLIAVMPENNSKWIYVDTLNRRPFNKQFNKAKKFINGYAEVDTGDIINRHGEKLPVSGKNLLGYSENVFIIKTKSTVNKDAVNVGDVYFSDEMGTNLYSSRFQDIKPFVNGMAIAKQDNLWGGVNHAGLWVIPPKYNRIFPLDDGNFMAVSSFHYGLGDKNGTIVIPPDYDLLKFILYNDIIGADYVRVELGEKIGYYRINMSKSDRNVWLSSDYFQHLKF